MENIITIHDLSVLYDKKGQPGRKAVDALNLTVTKGEIFGFLGPNGAGKTSTIKALLGIIVPTSGAVKLFGNPISPKTMKTVGYMPEIANYYWYLTPRELLTFYGTLFGIKKDTLRKRINDLLELVGLSRQANNLVQTFSKGMLQKVSFAQSLINDPELLILDEPTTGLDPLARMDMRDTLKKLKNRGKTIFFSSHELSEVEIVSDSVAILKNGKLLKVAHPNDIIDEKGQQISLENYFFDLVRDK